jgi:thiol-disulfide isomerase/thioredoxin
MPTLRIRRPRRRGRAPLLPLAAALVAVAAAAGCSSSGGSAQPADIGGSSNAGAGITTYAAGDRVAAPRLSGTTVDGKPYTTSYQGHVTVLNVWGSWCTDCRKEAPSLSEAAKAYSAKGVEFLGIDYGDNSATARAYEAQFGIAYPSLADADETLMLSLREIVPAQGVPATLVIDPSGKVAVRMLGSVTEPELDRRLDQVLSAH